MSRIALLLREVGDLGIRLKVNLAALQGRTNASRLISCIHSIEQTVPPIFHSTTLLHPTLQHCAHCLPPLANPQVQANVPGAQSPGDVWFYPDGSYSQTMYYQLPAGLTCDGVSDKCILQWNYLTGNTCTPTGTPAQYANSALPMCATPQAQYPEEFWNCADITIGGSGDVVQTPQGSGSQPLQSSGSQPAVQATPGSHQAGNVAQDGNSASPSGPCGAKDAQCGCEGKGAGNHGDVAGGCAGFFSCADNVRAYIACPSGLLYRKDLDTCDWPANVPDCAAQG